MLRKTIYYWTGVFRDIHPKSQKQEREAKSTRLCVLNKLMRLKYLRQAKFFSKLPESNQLLKQEKDFPCREYEENNSLER